MHRQRGVAAEVAEQAGVRVLDDVVRQVVHLGPDLDRRGQLREAVDSQWWSTRRWGYEFCGVYPEPGGQMLRKIAQRTDLPLGRVTEHLVAWAHGHDGPDAIRQALNAAPYDTAP